MLCVCNFLVKLINYHTFTLYLSFEIKMNNYMILSRFTATLILLALVINTLNAQYIESKPAIGQKALKSMVKTFLDYPANDLKSKTQGTVKIEFTTDKTGTVTDYNIVQNVSKAIDSSALSLFRLIIWDPATSDGKPVAGKSDFEIKYNTKSFEKLAKRRGYKHIKQIHNPFDTSYTIYNIKQVTELPYPLLPKGYKTLPDYIYSQLVYPEAAMKLGLAGEVELMFIIETNGLPSNIITKKHLGGGCTEEAIRILEGIKWYPGLLNDSAVRTSYNLTIGFKQGENKDDHIPNQQGTGI